MITLLFKKGTEVILVSINGNDIRFGNTSFGAKTAPIEGLFITHEGVIKEFPDLKDDKQWKEKSTKRFKDKVATFKTEDAISNFIISEMEDMGYIPWKKQKGGFRAQSIK